jgi:hypothetical protein
MNSDKVPFYRPGRHRSGRNVINPSLLETVSHIADNEMLGKKLQQTSVTNRKIWPNDRDAIYRLYVQRMNPSLKIYSILNNPLTHCKKSERLVRLPMSFV